MTADELKLKIDAFFGMDGKMTQDGDSAEIEYFSPTGIARWLMSGFTHGTGNGRSTALGSGAWVMTSIVQQAASINSITKQPHLAEQAGVAERNKMSLQDYNSTNTPILGPIHDTVHDTDVFFSWSQLQGRRLFTKTVWQKCGYLPIPDISPAGILCVSTMRVSVDKGLIPTHHLVVSRSEDTLIVVDKSFNLYSYEQVEPIYLQKQRTSEQSTVENTTYVSETLINTNIHQSPSPSSIPFVPQNLDKNDVSADKYEGFDIIKEQNEHKGKCAYVPECFTAQDEKQLGELKEEAYCVFHMLHFLRVTQKKGRDAWIDLACNLMEDLMGWRSWKAVKAVLLNTGHSGADQG